MTKLMLIPSDKNFDYKCDSYLIGIDGLSVNMPIYYSIEEVESLSSSKEIFVSLNKNMHSSDLELLESILVRLSKLDIKGVFFYDIGVLNMVKRLGLNIPLVWAQEHMTNNYMSVNFWKDKGVDYTLLSEEISSKDIIDIRNNSDCGLIVPIFGYFPMFVSRRHLKKNYLDRFDLSDDSSINYITKEGFTYPIVDSSVTTVYTSSYLNGIKDFVSFSDSGIDYVLLNSFLVSNDDMNKVLNMFNSVSDNNKEEYFDSISEMLGNVDTFFLHKESIYKVK